MVNLCNDGTKDFAGLWEIYIWKSNKRKSGKQIFHQTNETILN